MTYENEIFFTEHVGKRYVMNYPSVALTAPQQRLGVDFSFRLMVRCSYPVARHPDPSSSITFRADTTGIGTIVRTDGEGNNCSSKLTSSPSLHSFVLDQPTSPSAAHESQGPLYIDFKPVHQFLNRIRGQYLQGSSRV